MQNRRLTALLAILAVSTVVAGPAIAAETQVNCYDPISQISTGLDGTAPRFTIRCASTNLGNITYFAYKVAQNASVAQMLQRQLDFFIQTQLEEGFSGNNIDLILYTDVSNISGNSWGCGSSNCRIIDYMTLLY